jgi:DNA helicase-2/ATP-dependent DNA helicase PcrA
MHAVAAAPVKTWSAYQSRIFDFVTATQADLEAAFNGKRNGVVIGVAGCGKSTTIEEAYKRAGHCSAIVLAFNKPIADELKAKGVNARTFHSLTFGAVMRHKRQKDPTENKLQQIIDATMTGEERERYGSFVARLVSLGRNAGIGCLQIDTPDNWLALVEHHDLELDHEEAKLERALELASQTLEASNMSPLVDFDDMLYLAVRDGLTLPKFDFVFVDELQDTNAIQRAIIRKIMHARSRIVGVGDPAQSIYGFRGADSDSMRQFAEEFDAIELPLTVSYRCPVSVVKFAHKWHTHIEAAPNAIEGTVLEVGTQWTPKTFERGDLIVCRTTRPLISAAYQLIKARVPARIMGKEIGKGLASLVNKMRAKGVDRLVEKLNAYTSREVEKAIAKKQEAKAEQIADKTAAVLVIIESLPETNRTVPAVLDAIDALFSNVGAAVTLATIHKSKGLEANNVFWLNSSQCPSPWAKQPWQQAQERNLCYVAATRARRSLVLIEERRDEKREAA